jgi:hypothetical protein
MQIAATVTASTKLDAMATYGVKEKSCIHMAFSSGCSMCQRAEELFVQNNLVNER